MHLNASNLPTFFFLAIEYDRFNIFMRSATFLVTALLKELNIFNVIDKHKIWILTNDDLNGLSVSDLSIRWEVHPIFYHKPM